VLGGIYNTDPAQQSIMVASPIMREMEKESGSLIRATFARMTRRKKVKRPRFINFKEGMQQLPNELAACLSGDLRLNARVVSIEKTTAGFAAILSTGERLEAEVIILATLANESAALLKDSAPETAEILTQITHENSGTISFVYRESDLPEQPMVNGLMIPRREKRAIDAMTVTSRKMPERSHPGFALMRVFFGGAKPELVNYNDEELVETVTTELRELLGIQSQPLAHVVFRWEAGFPQARVNHLKLVAAIEATLPAGIFLAGSSYRGIAVPDCIGQGRNAATNAANAVHSQTLSYPLPETVSREKDDHA
jgi:protoporphyrinogen/coproporphyrinogen III oxidase